MDGFPGVDHLLILSISWGWTRPSSLFSYPFDTKGSSPLDPGRGPWENTEVPPSFWCLFFTETTHDPSTLESVATLLWWCDPVLPSFYSYDVLDVSRGPHLRYVCSCYLRRSRRRQLATGS